MRSIPRSSTLAALALGLFLAWGCGAESNEKDFAPIPGSAPPGAPANAEERVPPPTTAVPKAP